MPLNYEHIMSLTTSGDEYEYSEFDTMLYGIGIGFGQDPLDENELPFVYEKDLKAMPTQAMVIAFNAADVDARSGADFSKVVHGEQRLIIHKPLPVAARIIVDTRVVGAWDKGEGKGATYAVETTFRDKASGDRLVTHTATLFARADGGFGGPREGAPKPHMLPERSPDFTFETEQRPDLSAIYRLSGDRTPLHIDPDYAKAAGFPAPILHGLCTYGTCCRVIVSKLCDFDPTRIREFDARFSSPLFLGEDLLVDIWRDGDLLSFRARAKDRDAVVLNNGRCLLGPSVEIAKPPREEAVFSIP